MLRLIFDDFLSTNNIFSGLCSSERIFGSYCPLLSLGLLQIHGTQGTLVPSVVPQGTLVSTLVPQGTLVSILAHKELLFHVWSHKGLLFRILQDQSWVCAALIQTTYLSFFVCQPHLKTWKLYVAPRVCKFTTKFSCDKNLYMYNLISDLFTHSSPFCGSLVTFFACLKKVCQHHGWRK